jgi:thiol-disulfide isomerase/thioredoxin
MRLIYGMIGLLLLTLVACDRFDHDFKNDSGPDTVGFTAFVADFDLLATTALNSDDLNGFMGLFADDYYNNGIPRDTLRSMVQGLMAIQGAVYQVESEVVNAETYSLRYGIFTVTDSTETLVVSYFDTAIKTDNGFLLSGNGSASSDHAVLVEMFTAVWCPNCPAASEEVHELMNSYPGLVIPVEYIVEDNAHAPLDCSDIEQYYLGTNVSLPTAMFGGTTSIAGGSESSLSQYSDIIENALAQDFPMTINNLSCTNNGGVLHVAMDCAGTLPSENLVLKYAVIEETSSLTYQSNGSHLANVVLAKGQQAHPGTAGTVAFDVTAPDNMPTDAKLVVWLQKMNPSWTQGACPVYNCAQTYIGR